jgi:hypothetical protein
MKYILNNSDRPFRLQERRTSRTESIHTKHNTIEHVLPTLYKSILYKSMCYQHEDSPNVSSQLHFITIPLCTTVKNNL